MGHVTHWKFHFFLLKEDILGISLCVGVSVHMGVDACGCQRHWIPWI